MSGRGFEKAVAAVRVRLGLVTRLASHASGRLSGDQFCVYLANRLVIPSLKPEQLTEFATGALNLDVLTKRFINDGSNISSRLFRPALKHTPSRSTAARA